MRVTGSPPARRTPGHRHVKEGELDVAFDESTNSFGYIQPERDDEPIELSPEPNWGRVAYTPR